MLKTHPYFDTVVTQLESLSPYYPDIGQWFQTRVLTNPETYQLVVKTTDAVLAGFAIIKVDPSEPKICCVRALPDYQNRGVGIQLIDTALELLDTANPLVTVSEELLHHYSRIFVKRYGWSLDDVVKGRYRRGKLEYGFNGLV